jgi:hypothetical protein
MTLGLMAAFWIGSSYEDRYEPFGSNLQILFHKYVLIYSFVRTLLPKESLILEKFLTKMLCASPILLMQAVCFLPPHVPVFNHPNKVLLGEEFKLWSALLCQHSSRPSSS